MSKVDVVWFSENPDAISRGYWDQGWLEALFAGELWGTPPLEFVHHATVGNVEGGGAIVVVPARWHVRHIDDIQAAISRLGWCLLVLTGDEEGRFPRQRVQHPNMRVWVQTPHHQVISGERYVGDMWPPHTPQLLAQTSGEKATDWFFSGQTNTAGRKSLVAALRETDGGEALATPQFGSGMPHEEFLRRLSLAKVALCPGGRATPDTFRVFEALEAGCVPIVDRSTYWRLLFGEDPPLQYVDGWEKVSTAIDRALSQWPNNATAASAWFQRYKRDLVYRFYEDLAVLTGKEVAPPKITVLVPTSSAPADPDTAIIEETMSSVQERLPDVDTIVMMDGLHPQHDERRDRYAEYRRRVAWLCEHRWRRTYPLYFSEHRHQAAMTREALTHVQSPHILFVEHDAPLVGDIPFERLVKVLESGTIDVVRLHHEASVLAPHRHMMLDERPRRVAGVPILRTTQWSQRPHLATAAFYRRIIDQEFSENARTMIEDVMYGVVHNHWRDFGLAGWDRFRLGMFAPLGDIKRSTHLDARGDEPKVPMTNGET